MPKIERIDKGFSSVECNGCQVAIGRGPSTTIESTTNQGHFKVRLCDECIVLAAKKLILSQL